MVEQLLREAEQETWPASQEKKYLRLVRGKVIYISEAEAMEEKVLAGPRKGLSEEDILVTEWNCRVEWANQLKERISFVHQMIRDDNRSPSQYEPAYNTLWGEYRDAIESLIELDSEPVARFRDRVATRIGELEIQVNAICDNYGNWDPENFNAFERMLVCYEMNFDLMVALQSRLHAQALALEHKDGIPK